MNESLQALIGSTPESAKEEAFRVILTFVSAFCVGVAIRTRFSRGRSISYRVVGAIPDSSALLRRLGSILAIASLPVYVFGSGVEELFIRESYMVENIKMAKSAGSLGCLLSAFFIGSFPHRSRVGLCLNFILIAGMTFVFLGYSSRSFVLIPLMTLLGWILSRPSRGALIFLFAFALMFPVANTLPLFLRGQPSQGLIPLGQNILSMLNGSTELGYLESVDNFLFSSFDIIAATIWSGEIVGEFLIASLNPLPGTYTQFYSYFAGLHEFIPYAMMGEWACYSAVAGSILFLSIGFLFCLVEEECERDLGIYSIASRLLLFVFIFLSVQYTTRASTRMLVLLSFLMLVRRAWSHFQRSQGLPESLASASSQVPSGATLKRSPGMP